MGSASRESDVYAALVQWVYRAQKRRPLSTRWRSGGSRPVRSVFDQIAMYDGANTYNDSPLFRSGIMNSGSIVPADPVDCPDGQAVYDYVVEVAGCSDASDTLKCLRALYCTDFLNVANSFPSILSHNSVSLPYLPRPDGKVLTHPSTWCPVANMPLCRSSSVIKRVRVLSSICTRTTSRRPNSSSTTCRISSSLRYPRTTGRASRNISRYHDRWLSLPDGQDEQLVPTIRAHCQPS